ncbi:NADH-quinone oxidoreductase subunit K [soil metagenome]
MILLFSIAVAMMFASGCYLLLKRDFIKVIGGIVLISNAANFFLMTSGLSRGQEPIYPLDSTQPVSDPLVQAMTLTAIVISFGISALLISMIYRVYQSHRSVDLERISSIEERAVQREEQATAARRIETLEDREIDPDSGQLVSK